MMPKELGFESTQPHTDETKSYILFEKYRSKKCRWNRIHGTAFVNAAWGNVKMEMERVS